MRLYLSAISKYNIGYTPDTLIIRNNGKYYEYDIQGCTDYDKHSLSTRTKGELLVKKNEDDEDFVRMNVEDQEELFRLLRDLDSIIDVAIYPIPEYEEDERVKDDSLLYGSGRLEMADILIDFNFSCVYFG